MGGVAVVGEAGDGVEASEVVRRLRPDVVFLDIEMPEANGLEAVRLMGDDRPPAIVFVTAFDKYAIDAFEACALDYLLKPVDRARLARTLERVRVQLEGQGSGDLAHRLARLESLVARRLEPAPLRILAERRGTLFPIDVGDVDAFVADGRLVFAAMDRDRFLVNETLADLESKLADHGFARAHRGALVNLARIATIEPRSYGGLKVTMRDGLEIEASRRLTPALVKSIRNDER